MSRWRCALRGAWGAAFTLFCFAIPKSVQADEPWLMDIEALGGAPVSAPQRDWFNGGGSLAVGAGRPLAPWLLFEARLRTALFFDGDPPTNPGTKDPGNATLNSATGGLVLRLPDGSVRRATGPWAGASVGAGLTGKEVRATWEAGIGYGIAVGRHFALGPVVRFVQVVQPNSGINHSDARLFLAGLRLSLFDAAEPEPQKPVPDRDHDGIPDERDRCIDEAEDKDGFQDEDGCPEPDNDHDGVPDERDGCPNIPEDKDGFQDDDGCVDEDNDRDGVLDESDQCPLEPETVNGERDDDGCPDQGLIEMRDDRVVLEERVLFDTNSARLKRGAEPVLRAIIKLQKQHAEWLKMRVEGHADSRGDTVFNQQLSERRATAVREALIELGMDPQLIVAEGFGATRLRTDDTSDEGHRLNRRVEFAVIARHDDASAPLLSPLKPPPVPIESGPGSKEPSP